MKIAIVSHSLSLTGAPKVAIEMGNFLNELKYKVIFFNVNTNIKPEILNLLNKKIKYYPFPRSRAISVINKFLRIMKVEKLSFKQKFFINIIDKEKPDLTIFSTIFNEDLQDIIQQKKFKTARYIHEGHFFLRKLNKNYKRILNSSNFIIAGSKTVLNDLKKNKIKCINKPFYPPFSFDKKIVFKKNKNNKKVRILTVGNNFYRKGFDYAEQIAKKINKIATYTWYGSKENRFKNRFVKLRMPNKKISYFNYDLYSIVSRSESYNLTIYDAIKNGLKVIGWEHIETIKDLFKYKLSIPVKSFSIVDYEKKVNSYKKKKINKKLIIKFLKKSSFKNIYGKNLIPLINKLNKIS
jgi:hypothetical protein